MERENKKMEQRLCEAAIEGDVVSLHNIIREDRLILDKVVVGYFKGKSPLHVAISSGQTHFVEELLHHRPKLAEVLDSQQHSALHLASAEGHIEIVKALIKVNPEMCLVCDRDGRNPLHIAAMKAKTWTKGHTEIVKLLTEASTEMCLVRDRDGKNTLHIAATKGNIDVLEELVRISPQAARARVDRDETILHLCVKHNQPASLKKLLELETCLEFVNAKNIAGNTILHLAVLDKQYEITKHLLEKSKIDVNEKNGSGHTAMDILLLANGGSNQTDLNSSNQEDLNASNQKNLEDVLRKAKAKRADDLVRGDWIDKKKDALMIVASLIATMAFQAGVSPPGGVWQDDSNGHRAGEAVMAYNYPNTYPYFLHANTVGFVASLSTILLLSALPFKNKVFMWILTLIMWVTITSMAFTYAFSNIVVTPEVDRQAFSNTILTAVIVWCCVMIFLLMAHVVRFITHLIHEEMSRFKATQRITGQKEHLRAGVWSVIQLTKRKGRQQPAQIQI